MDKLVAKFRKNTLEEIQISVREYKGRQLIDIRIFAGPRGQETVPTQKGISLPLELFRQFKIGVDDAEEALEEAGLI